MKILRHLFLFLFFCITAHAQEIDKGELLYNGITLAKPWPPPLDSLTRQPMPLPYLNHMPEVIPIDIGRQLFVDDFLLESSTAERTYHLAQFHKTNPVLKPDRPWESQILSGGHPAPTAMVFSDGVWFDPIDRLFKMWYMAGYVSATAYATSRDGILWQKPLLDVKPGTNIVLDKPRDSATLWLDQEEKNPNRRYKLFVIARDKKEWLGSLYASADGIHWGEPVAEDSTTGDRTTLFYNPFRQKWVYSIRSNQKGMGRSRSYRECDDAVAGLSIYQPEKSLWVGADINDPMRADLNRPPELYNLDAVGYESVMLGLFSIWPGQPKDRAKPNYICLGFSRDGFHWHRPDHRPFINVSEEYGDWNWANIQSAGGGCLVVGDRLYFYFSARAGVKGSSASGVCTTGLATLRRDGFASLDGGKEEAVVVTHPVLFIGKHLFVNSDSRKGTLLVEILDREGRVIEPFTKANCKAIKKDNTLQHVRWKQTKDLSALAGQPVKFRFYLRNARLYSFWLSQDISGASHGYVAAGGPGFTGPSDTVGKEGYKAAKKMAKQQPPPKTGLN